MAQTFFFYDLETGGINPRRSRIMQFAGQRTDMDLQPVGEPVNLLIKMTEDTLPEPDAVMVHGTTPQQTVADGITEAEFIEFFNKEISLPETIFIGFNNIRFDDEFMRFLFYRNFNDPYEWQWKDGRGRWDLLDVSRMTRALRPDGIKWPFAADGKPTNRLEFLSAINKLDHANAHDALSDVQATIAVADLIRTKQPKLFDYLLNIRGKQAVQTLAESGKPFIYSSGKYPGEYEKTTVVSRLAAHPDKNGVLVYDLRHDPTEFISLNPEQLAERWRYNRESEEKRLPVKALQFNRCPAIAPLGVLDDDSQKRLDINLEKIGSHLKVINSAQSFTPNLLKALEIINAPRKQQVAIDSSDLDVDTKLYDGFIPDKDRSLSEKLRASAPEEISGYADKLSDQRLKILVPIYKARNFPKFLTDEERNYWEDYRARRLMAGEESSQLARFMARLKELSAGNVSKDKQYLLDELQLWAENILPDAH